MRNLLPLLFFFLPCIVFANTYTFTANGTSTFVVPAGQTVTTVKVWAAGGGGGGYDTYQGDGPYGAGGGGYSEKDSLNITAGTSIYIRVAPGGAGSDGNTVPAVDGGQGWAATGSIPANIFNPAAGSVFARAYGSAGGDDASGAGGGGNGGEGTFGHNGGNGIAADSFLPFNNTGGGGGGGAGSTGNGSSATNQTGAAGGVGGGTGGNGSDDCGSGGTNGAQPGGGGGSGDTDCSTPGGKGGDGEVQIITISTGFSPMTLIQGISLKIRGGTLRIQ